MNEIEKKYFEAFKAYVETYPKIQTKSPVGRVKTDFEIVEVNYSTAEDYREDFEEFKKDFGDMANMFKFDESEKLLDIKLKHTIEWKQVYEFVDLSFSTSIPEIDGYKPDFFIKEPNFLCEGFAIEIDGHEWHEKTKEQAANDRRKDRTYLKNGIKPIRFTGTEVFHDPVGCARETLEIIAESIALISDYTLLGREFGESIAIKKLNNESYYDGLKPINKEVN